jgi:hypothetical protein
VKGHRVKAKASLNHFLVLAGDLLQEQLLPTDSDLLHIALGQRLKAFL